jgi:predicted nuclease of predicted toxin-antitoxin system
VIRFLLDADLPRSATQALRDRGREALDIRDLGLGDASDDAIYRYAVAHGYVLVSADKGFTSVLRFPPGSHPGIIVLRFSPHTPADKKVRIVTRWIVPLDEHDVTGNLLIVEPRGIRIRRATPLSKNNLTGEMPETA